MKIADNHKNSMLVCLDKAHKFLIVGIMPRFSCGMHKFFNVKHLQLFCELINNVLRRFYAVFGAKCKTTDARFTISTFVVSLRCAFVCSCASIALFLASHLPWFAFLMAIIQLCIIMMNYRVTPRRVLIVCTPLFHLCTAVPQWGIAFFWKNK